MKKIFTISILLVSLIRPYKSQSQNSVLSNGNWYKIGVTEDSIYKLNYKFFEDIGINPTTINPLKISIYGYGGGMLPQLNSAPRITDLVENAIWVNGENDSIFNTNDYVLFYGRGPSVWNYNSSDSMFHFQKNIYADTNYYFITIGSNKGNRINYQSSTTLSATDTVTSFDDFSVHETDKYNLINSGREWYGEKFDSLTSYDFSFEFPNIDTSNKVYLNTKVVARSSVNSKFTVYANSQNILEVPVQSVSFSSIFNQYASVNEKSIYFNSLSSTILIKVDYNKPTSFSLGWLDFIELNARRKLKMSGSQLFFRNKISAKEGSVSDFQLSISDSNSIIWEITNPLDVKIQSTVFENGKLHFRLSTDSLKEFIAFDNKTFPVPTVIGQITNQNLHGLSQADMIIISPDNLSSEANRLATFHITKDGLSTMVVTPQQIYNEFSSGRQDITAIRDFSKMLYNKSSAFKFLLLFGDCSYDYKYRLINNTNIVPSYQSINSLEPVRSYVSDDYYGLLNNNEGEWKETTPTYETVDICIGRIPIVTTQQAKDVVNKIIQYTDTNCLGEWRNKISFVADDGDGNTHDKFQANTIADTVMKNYLQYNVEKIYVDAFEQIMGPDGQRAPKVNSRIQKTLNNGVLLVNYTGHGGEFGWASERILTIPEIQELQNSDNLPLLFTSTASFCRFDNPALTSGGELFLLNPTGGAIGLIGPSRVCFSNENFILDSIFINKTLDNNLGNYSTIGDIFKNTLNTSWARGHGLINSRNYSLLGDPALKLAYPQYNVITSTINGDTISVQPDTITAKSKINISGYIQDRSGNKLIDFNGTLLPLVFDKPSTESTLGDQGTTPFQYKVQNHIVFKGNVSIKNGEFNFSFIVPKDIDFAKGCGKISYYATNGLTDANGFFSNFIIGDSSKNISTDKTGPAIELYLNNKQFVWGDTTDQNSMMLVFLNDSSGINIVGKDSNHDIIATLDDTIKINLNEYFSQDINSYQVGKIEYPFYNLNNGRHKLKIKVWDVLNNHAEQSLEFVVSNNQQNGIEKYVYYNEEEKLIYPNPIVKPSNLHLFLYNNSSYDFILYDLYGRSIKKIKNIKSQHTVINLDNIKSGIYFYSIINYKNNSSSKGKLIIQ